MPRKSAAALATPTPFRKHRRPEPPAGLPPAAAAVWVRTLAGLREDWVGVEALPLLERYARHVARVGELEGLIAAAAPGGAEWRALVSAAGSETRHITAVARALRLTPQSRLRAETAATAARTHVGVLTAAEIIDQSDGLLADFTPRRPWE